MLAFDKTAAESEPETTGCLWWQNQVTWYQNQNITIGQHWAGRMAVRHCICSGDTGSLEHIDFIFEMLKVFFMFSFSLVVWECFLWFGRFRKRQITFGLLLSFSWALLRSAQWKQRSLFVSLFWIWWRLFGVCGSSSGEQCFFFSTLLFLFHARWSRLPLQLWPLWLTEG